MFVVKLYSRKIFLYVFFVRKYFHNEIKANYGNVCILVSEPMVKPIWYGLAQCPVSEYRTYSRKIWRRFKFGGLAVGVETAKLKSANIMLAGPAMRKT